MKNEIKTYITDSDKTPSRVFQAFGPWLCIAEKRTRFRDQDDNWLNKWEVTEEWQYNAEGWSKDIYPSGMNLHEVKKPQMLCPDETAPWVVESKFPEREKQSAAIYDYPRGVKWRQFINEHGTHMTQVFCLKSGWSVKSNMHPYGSLTDGDLDKLVNHLMQVVPKAKKDEKFLAKLRAALG